MSMIEHFTEKIFNHNMLGGAFLLRVNLITDNIDSVQIKSIGGYPNLPIDCKFII